MAHVKAETQYAKNRCDTAPRQAAATACRDRLPGQVAATEFCHCDLSHEFKLVCPITTLQIN